MRVLPQLSDDLNEDWITDKVRFSYDSIKRQRLLKIFVKTKLLQKFEDQSFVNLSVEKTLKVFAEQFYDKFQQTKIINLNILLGKTLDLESILAAKTFSQNWFEPFFSLESLKTVPLPDSRSNYLAPTLLSDLDYVEYIVLNGLNLRLDFPIINIKVKKRVSQNLVVFNVGSDFNSNFSKINLGSSFAKFSRTFLTGKHALSKLLINEKTLWLNG